MVIFSGRRPDEDAGGLTGQTGWLGERPGQHGSAYRRYTSAVDICDHRRQFRSDPRLREAVMWSVAVQVLIGLAILSVVVVLAAGPGPSATPSSAGGSRAFRLPLVRSVSRPTARGRDGRRVPPGRTTPGSGRSRRRPDWRRSGRA